MKTIILAAAAIVMTAGIHASAAVSPDTASGGGATAADPAGVVRLAHGIHTDCQPGPLGRLHRHGPGPFGIRVPFGCY